MIVRCWLHTKSQYRQWPVLPTGQGLTWNTQLKQFIGGGSDIQFHKRHPDGSADLEFTKDCVIPNAVVWGSEHVPGDFNICVSGGQSNALRTIIANAPTWGDMKLSTGFSKKSAVRNSLGHLLCDACGTPNEYAEPAADGGYTCRGCKMQREMWA